MRMSGLGKCFAIRIRPLSMASSGVAAPPGDTVRVAQAPVTVHGDVVESGSSLNFTPPPVSVSLSPLPLSPIHPILHLPHCDTTPAPHPMSAISTLAVSGCLFYTHSSPMSTPEGRRTRVTLAILDTSRYQDDWASTPLEGEGERQRTAAMKFVSTFTGYVRMILAANPPKGDLCMLATAIVSSIASGVPFPLIGIFFGQLLNDFNEVSCAEDAAASSSPSGGEDNSDYQSGVNDKVLMIVYLAIAQFVTICAHLTCTGACTARRLAQRLRERYLEEPPAPGQPSYFDGLPAGEGRFRA